MPVSDHPEDCDVSPYSRLSYTGSEMFSRCPRMFWYRYQLRLMEPQHAALYIGKIVESTLCRVIRDSPSLVSPDEPYDSFDSPKMWVEPKYQGEALDPIWRPSTNEGDVWPGPGKEVREKEDWPATREELEGWAIQRALAHFPVEFDNHVNDWMKNPNKEGELEFFESRKDTMLEMIKAGVDFHLEEVEDCLNAGGGPGIADFRNGDWRPDWPAPDGFPYDHTIPHPSANVDGELSWCEAWEVARPWFVDPVASDFSMNSVHPEGWLSGEYDLVYRWSGEIRIFDIKASQGVSSFSEGYPRQAAIYAYLWWVTHGREEKVVSQEIWYLGVPVRKQIPVPTDDEILLLEKELCEMYEKLYAKRSSDESDFPTDPKPVTLFHPGGVPSDEDPLPPENRCKSCSYSQICPGSPFKEELDEVGEGFTPISEIDPWLDIRGRVSSEPSMVAQYPRYTVEKLGFSLEVEGFAWPIAVLVNQDGFEKPDWLKEGVVVRLRNAITPTWICKQPGFVWHLRADLGASGSIEAAPQGLPTDAKPSQLQIKFWDVSGRIISFGHREDVERRLYNMPGEGYEKWAAGIADSTGIAQFQIFQGVPRSPESQQPFRQILNLGAKHDKWERGQEVVIKSAVAVEKNGVIVLEGKLPQSAYSPRPPVITQFLPVGWEAPKDPWELP